MFLQKKNIIFILTIIIHFIALYNNFSTFLQWDMPSGFGVTLSTLLFILSVVSIYIAKERKHALKYNLIVNTFVLFLIVPFIFGWQLFDSSLNELFALINGIFMLFYTLFISPFYGFYKFIPDNTNTWLGIFTIICILRFFYNLYLYLKLRHGVQK